MLTHACTGWDRWAVPEEGGWCDALSLWHSWFNATTLLRPTPTNFRRHARKWWCDGDIILKNNVDSPSLPLSSLPTLPRERTDHLLTNNGLSVCLTMCWSLPVPVLSSIKNTLFNRCWRASVISQHLFGKYVYTQPSVLEFFVLEVLSSMISIPCPSLSTCYYLCVCVCVCVVLQAASYGIGVMAQHCAKDFRQACLGMPWGVNNTNPLLITPNTPHLYTCFKCVPSLTILPIHTMCTCRCLSLADGGHPSPQREGGPSSHQRHRKCHLSSDKGMQVHWYRSASGQHSATVVVMVTCDRGQGGGPSRL